MKSNLSVSAAFALALASPLSAGAQSLPTTGALLCNVQYEHALPVGTGSKNMIMESAGLCTFEKGAPAGAKATFVVGLEFDEKGVGTLLYGGGHTTLDGKVIGLRQMLDAKYILKMKDGKVVGWTSSGTARWTAGKSAGKTHPWTAMPTGSSTLRIDYVLKQ